MGGVVAGIVWGEGPVHGEWFLREQEGMEGTPGLRRDTAYIVTWEGFTLAAGANDSNLHCS